MTRRRMGAAVKFLLFWGAACGWCNGGRSEQLQSPDGRRVALLVTRQQDRWDTIVVKENGKRHDVLPGDVGGRLGSPGKRSLILGTWVGNDELTFLSHCGTGCVSIHLINVASGALTELWTGNADGSVYWSPERDRAIVEGHLGSLVMVYLDGRATVALPGCRVVRGAHTGYWYAF